MRAYALVDEQDAWVNQRRWYLHSSGYAARKSEPEPPVYLHRLLLDLQQGDQRQGDHINGDRLDNRRSNLRVTSSAENKQNQHTKKGASRFRGVYLDRKNGRWYAQVKVNGKRHHLGKFDTELEAAKAASDARKRLLPFSSEPALAKDDVESSRCCGADLVLHPTKVWLCSACGRKVA